MAKACSEHTRTLRSEAAKRRWADPAFKEMVSKKLRKRVSIPCQCGCGEMTARGKKYLVGHNARVNHPMQGKKQSEEAIRKMIENHAYLSGAGHPMFGKTHTDEVRKRMSESHKGVPLSEEHRKNIGLAGRKPRPGAKGRLSPMKGRSHTEEAKKKNSDAHKGKRVSPGTEFTSERMRALHCDPVYMDKVRKSLNIRPNKPETIILNLLGRLYHGQWKYTGDFSFIINGKSPDFVNCNGQKKIIELFGDYWHKGQDPQDRINAFKPFGYDTLIIWERELKDIDSVIKKIHEFGGGA